MENRDERRFVGVVLVVFVVMALLRGCVMAQASVPSDLNTEHCLQDSLGNFWVLHLYATPQGHVIMWGHIHLMELPKDNPSWTVYFTGSGTIYPRGHAKEGTADFTISVASSFFGDPGVVAAQMSGSLRNDPIVYTGSLRSGDRLIEPFTLTLLSSCHTHP